MPEELQQGDATGTHTNIGFHSVQWEKFVLFVLAFVLYGNTIGHDYAFDDLLVITNNQFTQKGISGIPDLLSSNYLAGVYGDGQSTYDSGRYRPLSLIWFALEDEFFGRNTHVHHFMNVLFYALTVVLLFSVLKKLFTWRNDVKTQLHPTFQNTWCLSLPFVITLLFVAHPLHTEVVANIKSRDETLALMGALGAMWFCLKHVEQQKYRHLIVAGIIFLLALLSNEKAIAFVVLLPLSIYYFPPKPSAHPTTQNLALSFHKKLASPIWFTLLPLCLAAMVYGLLYQLIAGHTTTLHSNSLITHHYL